MAPIIRVTKIGNLRWNTRSLSQNRNRSEGKLVWGLFFTDL